MSNLIDMLRGGSVVILAEVVCAQKRFFTALYIWTGWMILSSLSLFAALWLYFFGFISVIALPVIVILVLSGLAARPQPFVITQRKEEDKEDE